MGRPYPVERIVDTVVERFVDVPVTVDVPVAYVDQVIEEGEPVNYVERGVTSVINRATPITTAIPRTVPMPLTQPVQPFVAPQPIFTPTIPAFVTGNPLAGAGEIVLGPN